MKSRLFSFIAFILFSVNAQAQVLCDASFNVVQNPNGSYTFTCIGNNQPGTVYNWNFGNNIYGTGNPVTVNYNNVGTYQVCLNVSSAGCTDTSCATITVGGNIPCSANFSANVTGTTALLTNLSYAANTPTYAWYEGGNLFSTSVNTSYSNVPGTYNIILVVNDAIANCTDSFTQQVVLTNAPTCQAGFNSVVNGNTATFTNTSSGANPLTYTWLANGNVFSNLANPSYTDVPGTYSIVLVVYDAVTSCVDSAYSTVTFLSSPCQAGFYIYPDSNGPAHTYLGVNTSAGPIATYTWAWGDGTFSNGMYPSHTYASAGNYQICLYVAGSPNTNCVDTFCMNATINKTATMYSINFMSPLGVNSTEKEPWSIYPNPSTGLVTIKGLNGEEARLDIYTISGQKVSSVKVKDKAQLNVSSLPSNLYLFKIHLSNGSVENIRFLKQ